MNVNYSIKARSGGRHLCPRKASKFAIFIVSIVMGSAGLLINNYQLDILLQSEGYANKVIGNDGEKSQLLDSKQQVATTRNNNREQQTKHVKEYNSTNFLQFYVEARGKHCTLKQKFEPDDISYCAVARSGSTTLSGFFTHHNHDCTVKDLERLGARRIVIALRHPLARISSGFSRRMEGKVNGKPANRLINDNFREGGVELYISALRDVYHPLHDVAFNATFGQKRQSYFLPVTEFYLHDSQRKAEVYFVCIESFQDDLEAAWAHWNRRPKKKGKELLSNGGSGSETLRIRNPSLVSSGNWTNVLSRFSIDSIQWVEKTFENDLHLYQRHCPGGYESYIESLSKKMGDK